MKPLILTCSMIPEFMDADFADLAIFFDPRFIWGQLPSLDEVAAYLGPRTPDNGLGYNWSNFSGGWGQSKNKNLRDRSFIAFCQQYEVIELWFDTNPSAQLQLVWLLDFFRCYPAIVARLKIRLVNSDIFEIPPKGISKRLPLPVDITEQDLATASAAWRAYRAATPEACFNLLSQDLSALPLLRPVLFDLLAELPSGSTGLGATEMRMLEIVGTGYKSTNALFYLRSLRQTRVFSASEIGYLLDGLAFGPRPAIAGLDEALRTIDRDDSPALHEAHLRSRLTLTEFGKALLAHKEDFSRHNPIDRWWGGTHLTNDRLWRWDPVLTAPAERG